MKITRLSPEQARTLFGELRARLTEAYQHFPVADGIWRPEFNADKIVTGYRLEQGIRMGPAPYVPEGDDGLC